MPVLVKSFYFFHICQRPESKKDETGHHHLVSGDLGTHFSEGFSQGWTLLVCLLILHADNKVRTDPLLIWRTDVAFFSQFSRCITNFSFLGEATGWSNWPANWAITQQLMQGDPGASVLLEHSQHLFTFLISYKYPSKQHLWQLLKIKWNLQQKKIHWPLAHPCQTNTMFVVRQRERDLNRTSEFMFLTCPGPHRGKRQRKTTLALYTLAYCNWKILYWYSVNVPCGHVAKLNLLIQYRPKSTLKIYIQPNFVVINFVVLVPLWINTGLHGNSGAWDPWINTKINLRIQMDWIFSSIWGKNWRFNLSLYLWGNEKKITLTNL